MLNPSSSYFDPQETSRPWQNAPTFGPAHPSSAAIRPLTAIVIIALAACHNAPAIYQDRDRQGRMKSARPSSVGRAAQDLACEGGEVAEARGFVMGNGDDPDKELCLEEAIKAGLERALQQ